MPENEPVSYSDYDEALAAEAHAKLEEKFMEILSQPDVVIPADEMPEDGEFDEDQRATLQAVLDAEMQTPEEIERDIKIAEHNAEVQRKRDEKQAMKRARRANRVKSKRRRRR